MGRTFGVIWTLVCGGAGLAIGLWMLLSPLSWHRACFKNVGLLRPWYTLESAVSPLGQFLTRLLGLCIVSFVGMVFYAMARDIGALPTLAPHRDWIRRVGS